MRKAKKTLLAAACACALVVGSVAGTVAYLTATTDTVTNTFTVGNVSFKAGAGLDEASVNEYGVAYTVADATANAKDNEGRDLKATDGKVDRVTSNSYKLVPGHEYVKDPTVHMAAGSEDAYLFVKVTDGISAIEDGTTIAAQMTVKGWVAVPGVANVWCYCDGAATPAPAVVKAGANIPVFDSFKIKADAVVASYTSADIKIQAYAVQADGFSGKTAAEIWDAGGWTA